MICRPPPLLLHLAAPAVNRACSGWHAPPRAFSTVLVRCKGDAQGGHMAAPEMLWLFEGQQQSIDSGDMQPMLDAVWTLQYQIPGAICGFAGEVTTPEGVPGVASDMTPGLSDLLLDEQDPANRDGLTGCRGCSQTLCQRASRTPSTCASPSCRA